MKQQAAAIEYYHLVKEFQKLVDGRVDKIYQDEEFFLFQIYTGKRRVNLAIEIPNVAYLTENKPSFAKPGGFCMFLRKRLQKGRITAIEQVRFDRILRLDIDVFEKQYRVYLELFGKGNLLVCDAEDKIISAYDNIVYKDRSLRGGVEYELPPKQLDTAQITLEEFKELCEGENVERVLATQLGLGGEYASHVYDEDLSVAYENLQALLKEVAPCYDETGAYLVGDGERTETFSEAIAKVLDPKRQQEKKAARVKRANKQQNKLEVRKKAQEKQIRKMEEKAVVEQRKAEVLYERYQDFSVLLAEAKKDRKTLSEKAFKEKYESLPFVTQADKTQIVVEVDE